MAGICFVAMYRSRRTVTRAGTKAVVFRTGYTTSTSSQTSMLDGIGTSVSAEGRKGKEGKDIAGWCNHLTA